MHVLQLGLAEWGGQLAHFTGGTTTPVPSGCKQEDIWFYSKIYLSSFLCFIWGKKNRRHSFKAMPWRNASWLRAVGCTCRLQVGRAGGGLHWLLCPSCSPPVVAGRARVFCEVSLHEEGPKDCQTLQLYGFLPPEDHHQVAATGLGSDPMLLGRKRTIWSLSILEILSRACGGMAVLYLTDMSLSFISWL